MTIGRYYWRLAVYCVHANLALNSRCILSYASFDQLKESANPQFWPANSQVYSSDSLGQQLWVELDCDPGVEARLEDHAMGLQLHTNEANTVAASTGNKVHLVHHEVRLRK